MLQDAAAPPTTSPPEQLWSLLPFSEEMVCSPRIYTEERLQHHGPVMRDTDFSSLGLTEVARGVRGQAGEIGLGHGHGPVELGATPIPCGWGIHRGA